MPADRPIGRDPVLAMLRAGAEAAAAGRGRPVLLSGEPGIGKTTVLGQFAREAAGAGARVLWAQCWHGDGAPAYWPWVQVLRAGMAAGGDAGAAAALLPETAVPADRGHDRGTEDVRFRTFDAVVGFLRRLGECGPLLVVLDDLHWADDGSLRLLEFAARHLPPSDVLLAGSYRDEEAGDRLAACTAVAEHASLTALDPAQVSTLMTDLTGGSPDPSTAEEVWRRTGGNPLLVRELTWLYTGRPHHRQLHPDPPQGLLATADEILGRRLARLSQPCAAMLEVAAAVGPEIRPGLLARLVDDPEGLPRLLDEAVRARVLQPDVVPAATYRFTHDLFRETIELGMTLDRRARLHIAAGEALEALRDLGAVVHPTELAAHYAHGIGASPEKSLHYSRLAAQDASARLAFEEARQHYERALAALELVPGATAADRLGLLLDVGEARHRAGDAKTAFAALREAADLSRRSSDGEALARAAIAVHELGWRHAHTVAIGLLEEAAASLGPQPSPRRARVLAALARDLHHAVGQERDWERAPALAAQAVEDARASGDPVTLGFCLLAVHDARWRPGTPTSRLPVIEEMLVASADAGDRGMAAQARLLRATALLELGHPSGLAELEAFCRQSEQLGHARGRYGAVTRRATSAVIVGDLERAHDLAAEGLALGEAIGEQDARGVYETLLWAAYRSAGTWHVDASEPDPRHLESEPWPEVPLVEATRLVASGDVLGAGRALARMDLGRLPAAHDLEMLAFLAEAVAAAGTPAQRGAVLELLAPHAGLHVVVGGCASYLGAVDHYLGLLARASGNPTKAREHFLAAAEMHDRMGAPRWAERSRHEAEACRAEDVGDAGVFRRSGAVWTITFRGHETHHPDSKGLRDLAVLVQHPDRPVHAMELLTGHPPRTGADAVLDDRAKAEYRRRLAQLDAEIADAETDHDLYRSERAVAERDAIIAELSAALGLGGRDRRLGGESERARKAVTARMREAIGRLRRTDPALADHLRDAVRTGTWCSYEPAEPVRWFT